MLAVTLLVVSVRLADSLNPSTLITALWIARAPSTGALVGFTFGVFAVYLAGGLVFLLGPGPALIDALHHVRGPVEHAVEAAGGVLVLAFACALWRSRGMTSTERRRRGSVSRSSAFGLGAGIMAIELPTAFMYFGAISAILAGHHPAPLEIALVIAYNALFVAPLVALLVAVRLAGPSLDRLIASAGERLRYLGQLALTGVAGAAGATLLTLGVVGLLVV